MKTGKKIKNTLQNIQMMKKHIKTCSTSYVITELQISSKVKYHYAPIMNNKFWKLTLPVAGEDMDQQKLSFIVSGNAKLQFWKTV